MISSTVMRALVAAGATTEMLIAAVEAAELAAKERAAERAVALREGNRRRQAALRARRNASNGVTGVTSVTSDASKPENPDNSTARNAGNGVTSVTPDDPPTLPYPLPLEGLEDNSKKGSPKGKPQKGSCFSIASFDEFWELYPNKVGKQDARRSWERVARSGKVSLECLMAGLNAYVAKTDDRPWCNPATWLNQGRWDDVPAPRPAANGGGGWDVQKFLSKIKAEEERKGHVHH